MPGVQIAEGFGAWGDLGTLAFQTTATYSCYGVAAWDQATSIGGIYHVGAKNLVAEQDALMQFFAVIAPTHCVVSRGQELRTDLPMNPMPPDERAEFDAEYGQLLELCHGPCPHTTTELGPRAGLHLRWDGTAIHHDSGGTSVTIQIPPDHGAAVNSIEAGRVLVPSPDGFMRPG